MKFHSDKHHRRSIRLPHYDYVQPGAYFVTICTKNRVCLLGDIVDEKIRLSDQGTITLRCWTEIAQHFSGVETDAFVVMPNHVHGILTINPHSVGAETMGARTAPLLGRMVAYFKYQSTTCINELCKRPAVPVWQRNYYEHVIRNEEELNSIRQYIIDNPKQWELDRENPANVWTTSRSPLVC